jgi:hypothetical protein
MVLDAAGLALFAVAGAGKALEYKIHPFVAILMGCITGVGGGTMRDLLLAQVPTVLRADVYASAALAGAAVMIAGLRLPPCGRDDSWRHSLLPAENRERLARLATAQGARSMSMPSDTGCSNTFEKKWAPSAREDGALAGATGPFQVGLVCG